ncbi:probable ATP-dependent RNA helicase DDX28 [Strongylocentrotus purpuratus]|uniref:RNA helicase n=1 Tax=Strongylocentrotus purpuratus TaxID=7668 RepID=A0A7M7PUC4_STRPU|nr:probable ATP-dependent RNA helicase DDX28 [Strongylocentrotus purpuratus]
MEMCHRCVLRFHNLICHPALYNAGYYPIRYASSRPSPDSDIPVIRVPKALQNKVQTIQQGQKRGPVKLKGRIFTARPGTEIISSKNKEYNHYLNQTYEKLSPPKLTSQGWKSSRSRGDYFTILAYKGNPSIAKKGDSEAETQDTKAQTFQDLKLHPSIIKGLDVMDIVTPTSIQLSAIPVILRGKNTLCAAETGSGKTLTYLLPLMQRLVEESKQTDTFTAEPGLPRCVVLVPVGELVHQVWEVAKILADSVGLSVQYIDGETSLKSLEKRLSISTDIIISTPGPIINAVRQGYGSLDCVSHIVIDESDTMLDDSFIQQTLKILKRVNVGEGKACKVTAPGEAQLTMVGATMPRKATNILAEIIPPENLEVISTPHVHRIMPHVHQKFLRLHSEDKALKILELVKREQKRRVPTMVFCNMASTCDWLAHILTENGIPALRLHSKMGGKSRSGVMEAFKSGEAHILVCSDIASRGVDTVQVQHVVNFDFPPFMSDYIHRAGRVGRVGSQGSGHVTNFVVHKWDVELVNKIERAVRTREDLPRVDANIKQKHVKRLEDQDLQDADQALKG